MISWMVYAALIGMLVAAGALALERLVSSMGCPRRFVWLAALALAGLLPLVGGLGDSPEPVVVPTVAATESAAPSTLEVTSGQGFIPPLPLPTSRTAARTAALAWGMGSAAALAAVCAVLFSVARARRRWARTRVDGSVVYVSRNFGPALVGIASPRVVIPSWVLESDTAARAAILRHEQEHARAYDHLALLYATLVAAVFPWSPAIWWMCRRLRAAVEMDCDQRVIAGGIGAADYGAVLLHAGSRSQARWGFAPAMGQPRSLLEWRLRTMSEKKKKVKATHGVLLVATALVALGIACDATAPTSLEEAIEEVVTDALESRDNGVDERLADLWYDRFQRAFQDFRVPAGSKAPVVVVDGRRVSGPARTDDRQGLGTGNPMAELGPESIARVEILMGAAAQSIYGAEAADGVVRIVTSAVGGDVPPANGQGLDKLVDQLKDLVDMPGLEHVDIRLREGRVEAWSGNLDMGGEEIDAAFERFGPLMTYLRDRQGESG